MHSISTFIFGQPGETSRSHIFDLVKKYFGEYKDVAFSYKELPLNLPSQLVVRSGSYSFSVAYLDDPSIGESIEYIEKITGKKIVTDKELLCEVRTIFGDDPESDFDHITISMYQFLEEIPSAIVYDVNQEKVVAYSI